MKVGILSTQVMHLQWAMNAGSHCVQIDIPLLGLHYLERQVVAALGPGPATSRQQVLSHSVSFQREGQFVQQPGTNLLIRMIEALVLFYPSLLAHLTAFVLGSFSGTLESSNKEQKVVEIYYLRNRLLVLFSIKYTECCGQIVTEEERGICW